MLEAKLSFQLYVLISDYLILVPQNIIVYLKDLLLHFLLDHLVHTVELHISTWRDLPWLLVTRLM